MLMATGLTICGASNERQCTVDFVCRRVDETSSHHRTSSKLSPAILTTNARFTIGCRLPENLRGQWVAFCAGSWDHRSPLRVVVETQAQIVASASDICGVTLRYSGSVNCFRFSAENIVFDSYP